MELNQFIELTLKQIAEGISSAQKSEGGENINALSAGKYELGGNLINLHRYGVFTRVDFDVSVSAETSGGGGAKLSVFGIGAEGSAERKVASANRVQFSVPVRLPDGDKSRVEAAKKQSEEHEQERKRKLAQSPRGGSWMG